MSVGIHHGTIFAALIIKVIGTCAATEKTQHSIHSHSDHNVFVNYQGRTVAVDSGPEDNVRTLIHAFCQQTASDPDDVDAMFEGRLISDSNAMLSDLGIGAESTMEIINLDPRHHGYRTVFNVLTDPEETERVLGNLTAALERR